MANSNGWGDGAANNSIGWGQGANNAIAWGDSHAKSWAGATDIVGITTDPEASAYFTATGITGATQQTAIDNLVKGLKSDGLWSKMKAVYPFVTDNRNLLSYTEDFSNGFWTSPMTRLLNSGLAPDGTNTANALVEGNKSNTYLVTSFASINLSPSIYTISVYAKKSTRDWLQLYMNDGTTNRFCWFNLLTGTLGTVQTGATASILDAGNGWYRCMMSMTMSSSGNNAGFGPSSGDGVSNYTGNSSTGILAWGAQLELGSTATTYQPIATTQQAFISNQFKYNLVNPVDSDAAFRLVFNGGWTHSANGATPNGTNGFADTKFSANANQTVNNCSVSAYVRTSTNASTSVGEFGAAGAVAFLPLIALQSTTLTTRNQYCWDYNVGSGAADINTSDSSGMWGVSRSSASSWQSFERNVAISKTTNTTQSSLPTANIYIGAVNHNGTAINFSFRQIAFAHMGNSLTNSEFNNLYTRVQAFQTALSRQV